MNYDQLIEKMREGERFSFSRWGDGEWACLLEKRPGKANCDGHKYFPSLGKALRDVLKDTPPYVLGLQNLANRMFAEDIKHYTLEYSLNWSAADILHKASKNGRLFEFVDSTPDNTLLVGPQHLKEFADANDWYYLNVPSLDCWMSYEEIRTELNALVPLKDWTILYCASMMSNVLIHEFHGKATQIDCGSVFDPYGGKVSRTYMKGLNLNDA